jgi:hypothetical protein
MLVAGKKMLHGLGDRELHVHVPAVGEHDDEEREPAPRIAHRNGAKASPVDLCALARSKVQLEINRQLGLADTADVIAQDGDAAAISLFAQPLEDLLGAVGMAIEQPCDASFEGIKDAATWWRVPWLEARARQPLGNRPGVQVKRSGGLRDRQTLAIVTVVDFAERLVVDHDRGL